MTAINAISKFLSFTTSQSQIVSAVRRCTYSHRQFERRDGTETDPGLQAVAQPSSHKTSGRRSLLSGRAAVTFPATGYQRHLASIKFIRLVNDRGNEKRKKLVEVYFNADRGSARLRVEPDNDKSIYARRK